MAKTKTKPGPTRRKPDPNCKESRTKKFDQTLHHLFPFFRPLRAEERQQAQELGLVIKEGKFTEDELKRLMLNFRRQKERLTKKFGPEEAKIRISSFVGLNGKKPEYNGCGTFLQDRLDFLLRCGKNLRSRLLLSIYNKCRDSFPELYGYRLPKMLNEEEIHMIITYVANRREQGLLPDYSKIAKELNLTPKHVQMVARHRLTADGKEAKFGIFSPEEDIKLLRIMMYLLNTHNFEELINAQNVPWKRIGELMNTGRTSSLVYNRFTRVIKSRLQYDLTVKAQINAEEESLILAKMIYFLKNKQYDNEDQIDWMLLAKMLEDKYSCRLLIQYFEEKLKSKLPDLSVSNFSQLVNYLAENTLPTLINMQNGYNKKILRRFYKSHQT